MVTPDTVVVDVDPDVGAAQFDRILHAADSPAKHKALEGFGAVASHRVSIAFALAIFKHESRFGHAGLVPQHRLKNPGATRSIRTGEGVVVDIPGRGPFVRYATWADGWSDLAFRLVDESFVYVKEGRRTIRQIIERWAPASDNNVPTSYINAVVNSMNEWIEEPAMTAEISGFNWEAADSDHYTRGRTVPIRGGAQHYTGGTNSLDWLTKTSVPPVSSTFLVKHEPTLTDRGWQLVKLEDTPWTTAFANSYTVSIEYEHHPESHSGIPDFAFTVLAQTWIDIAAKVKDLKLGFIPLDRNGIRGHKEWVNNPSLTCPDGVFVDRIVAEINRLQGGQDVDFDKVPTEPDPWRDHLGGNPYGREFWIPQVFVKNIRDNGGFGPVGFVTSGAFVDGAQLVQYFERGRLELNEGGAVTRGLVGLEVLAGRYPDRLP